MPRDRSYVVDSSSSHGGHEGELCLPKCKASIILSASLCIADVQLCGEFLPCDLSWPFICVCLCDFAEFLLVLKMFCQFLRIPTHIDWKLWWFDRKGHPQGVALLGGVALLE